MDHISSRFRRNKKGPPTTPQLGSPAGSPPDKSSSERKLGSTTSDRRQPPPSLTISTTHLPLDGMPMKSPFRQRFHFRNSNKRARSPTATTLPAPTSPAIVAQDGTVEPEKFTSANGDNKDEVDAIMATPKPKIPGFLTLSEQGMFALRRTNISNGYHHSNLGYTGPLIHSR